jgi:hypothetical protein
MVLSLFVATPAKTEASITNRDLLSIVLGTYDGDLQTKLDGTTVADKFVPGLEDDVLAEDVYFANFGITAGLLGFQPITEVKEYKDSDDTTKTYNSQVSIYKGAQKAEVSLYDFYINNGSYDLDSEDPFYLIKSQNTIVIILNPVHVEDYESLKGVQVYLGDGASTANGWEAAEFQIVSGLIVIAVQTTPSNEAINPGDIASLRTNIAYQYYFPKELTGFTELEFAHSVLTWKYTINNGHDYTYPTYPILGSAQNANEWYEVETIISANPGYDFILPGSVATPTKTVQQVSAEKYTELLAAIQTQRNAGLVFGDEGYDPRVFKVSDISKDGKTAKLTISNIYPTLTSKFVDPNITGIELTRELNFATNKVNTVAEAKANMPTKFVVKVNGERKEVDITKYLQLGYFEWIITDSNIDVNNPLDDRDVLTKIEYATDGSVSGNVPNYYATLRTTPLYDNKYNVTDDEMGALRIAMFLSSYADGHDLLSVYKADLTRNDPDTAATLNDKGWTVHFTINGEKNYGGMVKQETPGLPENSAPTIMFNGFGTTYTMTAYGAGTAHSAHATAANALAGAWTDLTAAQNTLSPCPTGDHYYKAYLEGIANVYTESPDVYEWFDPSIGQTHEMKQGAVSITVQDPAKAYAADEEVEHVVREATGSMDLAPTSANCGLVYAKTELYWTGSMKYGNTGLEKFRPETEYVATIAIPVRAGYTLSFTPEVRFNGVVADEVAIDEADGVTYLLAAYTFNKTTSDWDVEKDYCYKKLHITGLGIPYAGGVVPTELGCSDSSARFYKFVDVTWYENGVEFEGTKFELGKRYTAVVTYDCSAFAIKEDCQNKDILVTTDSAAKDRCIASAKITKADAELTATFNFPAADEKLCTGVSNVDITVPYGMPVADFYAYCEAQLYPVVTFADGTTGVAAVYEILANTGEQVAYVNMAGAFATNYPGILGYNPNKKEAQNFTFTAYVYVGTQLKACKINIHVSGMKQAVNFNANGGVYAGTTALVERGTAYGFKYVPAEIYREGYFFAGWFDAPTGGNRIYAKTIFDGKVTTLYAHWVKVFTGKVWTVTAKSYAAGRLTVTAKKPATKVDGYEFSYSKDGVNWITTTQLKNVAYLTGLESKGTYFVKVRAYRIDSAGKFVYGAYSTTIKAQAK